MASHHPLRVGHVVDAVERRDEVDRVVGRQRVLAGSWKRGVVEAGLGEPLAGAVEGVLRRCRSRRPGWPGTPRRAAAPRRPAPHPMSTTRPPAVSLSTTPSSAGARSAPGEPGSTARSCAPSRRPPRGRGCRSRNPRPVRKLSGSRSSAAIVCGRSWNIPIPNASWSGEARTATASGDSEKRVRSSPSTVEDPGRRLVVRPLPHPPLVEPGRVGQLGGGQRLAGVGQRGTARAGRRGGSSPPSPRPRAWRTRGTGTALQAVGVERRCDRRTSVGATPPVSGPAHPRCASAARDEPDAASGAVGRRQVLDVGERGEAERVAVAQRDRLQPADRAWRSTIRSHSHGVGGSPSRWQMTIEFVPAWAIRAMRRPGSAICHTGSSPRPAATPRSCRNFSAPRRMRSTNSRMSSPPAAPPAVGRTAGCATPRTPRRPARPACRATSGRGSPPARGRCPRSRPSASSTGAAVCGPAAAARRAPRRTPRRPSPRRAPRLAVAQLGERWIDDVEPVTHPLGLGVADQHQLHAQAYVYSRRRERVVSRPDGRYECRYHNGEAGPLTWRPAASASSTACRRPRATAGNGLAVAAMVCGIVAVVIAWIPFVAVVGLAGDRRPSGWHPRAAARATRHRRGSPSPGSSPAPRRAGGVSASCSRRRDPGDQALRRSRPVDGRLTECRSTTARSSPRVVENQSSRGADYSVLVVPPGAGRSGSRSTTSRPGERASSRPGEGDGLDTATASTARSADRRTRPFGLETFDRASTASSRPIASNERSTDSRGSVRRRGGHPGVVEAA